MKFLSICEAIDGLPYDMIEKIETYWHYWNIENKKDITAEDLYDISAENIIKKGGTKCISVEYEIVSDAVEGLKIIKFIANNP